MSRADLEELVDRHMSGLSEEERALACGTAGVAKVQGAIARLGDARDEEIASELAEGIALIDAGAALLGESSSAVGVVYATFVAGFRSLAADLSSRMRREA